MEPRDVLHRVFASLTFYAVSLYGEVLVELSTVSVNGRLVPPVHDAESYGEVCVVVREHSINIDRIGFILAGIFCALAVQECEHLHGTKEADQGEYEYCAE